MNKIVFVRIEDQVDVVGESVRQYRIKGTNYFFDKDSKILIDHINFLYNEIKRIKKKLKLK